MTHRYAEMLGWLQAGQQILGKWRGGEEGHFPVSFNSREVAYAVDGAEGWEFRLKPRTVKMGSREIEAPVLEPEVGTFYWTFDVLGSVFETFYKSEGAMSTAAGKWGSLFLTEDAAREASKAISALLRGEA